MTVDIIRQTQIVEQLFTFMDTVILWFFWLANCEFSIKFTFTFTEGKIIIQQKQNQNVIQSMKTRSKGYLVNRGKKRLASEGKMERLSD